MLCFFKRPLALCGESVVRNKSAKSVRGVIGGHAVGASCGSIW